MKNVKYIPESKAFMIDGKLVKEAELTPDKIKELKKLSENWNLLLGTNKIEGQLIL